MKMGQADPQDLVSRLFELSAQKGYTKIFAQVSSRKSAPFLAAGYKTEACIPDFFQTNEDALFLGYYYDEERSKERRKEELDLVVEMASKYRQTAPKVAATAPNSGTDPFAIRKCTSADATALAAIYAEVFPTYPFPIDDPDYILETMKSDTIYFVVEASNNLVAAAAAEIDKSSKSAEMTDFATRPAWRGKGFARHLLACMETDVRQRGIRTSYTIARAISPGINITFAHHDYIFAGRLINNTNIGGGIESMNVWYKTL